jgi:hypothetical protein
MPSERFLRQIDRFLDQAEEAATNHEWTRVADAARAVLAIDDQNEDAETFRRISVHPSRLTHRPLPPLLP